jgi:hypothetical protein
MLITEVSWRCEQVTDYAMRSKHTESFTVEIILELQTNSNTFQDLIWDLPVRTYAAFRMSYQM